MADWTEVVSCLPERYWSRVSAETKAGHRLSTAIDMRMLAKHLQPEVRVRVALTHCDFLSNSTSM